jgi:hypothetical protein
MRPLIPRGFGIGEAGIPRSAFAGYARRTPVDFVETFGLPFVALEARACSSLVDAPFGTVHRTSDSRATPPVGDQR